MPSGYALQAALIGLPAMAAAIAIHQNGNPLNIFAGTETIKKPTRSPKKAIASSKSSTHSKEAEELDGTTAGSSTPRAVPVSDDDVDFMPALNSVDTGESYIYGFDVMNAPCKCCPPPQTGGSGNGVQVCTRGRRRGQYRVADGKPAKMGPWRPVGSQA